MFSFLYATKASGQNFKQLFSSQDYELILSYTNPVVKFEINREKKKHKASVAINKVKEAIDKLGSVQWERVHKGMSDSRDANYVILKATNNKGDGIRIFISLENKGDEKRITSFRIRKLL